MWVRVRVRGVRVGLGSRIAVLMTQSFHPQGFFCNFVDSMDGFSTWVDVLVPMLKEIGASEADLEMLFRTNAMRVYGIHAST